jgi:hypothetical protein
MSDHSHPTPKSGIPPPPLPIFYIQNHPHRSPAGLFDLSFSSQWPKQGFIPTYSGQDGMARAFCQGLSSPPVGIRGKKKGQSGFHATHPIAVSSNGREEVYFLLVFITFPQHIRRVVPIPLLETTTFIPQGMQT